MKKYIFGAKATATGFYKALSVLEPEKKISAFLVSNTEENISEIYGCPVKRLSDVANSFLDGEKSEILIYVAVPELIHAEIKELLASYGFKNNIMVDSRMEANIMERYFCHIGKFKSIHSLKDNNNNQYNNIPKLTVYAASFYKDKPLKNPPNLPEYIKSLYLGCNDTTKKYAEINPKATFFDNSGDNISYKNPNYCEMTAHYWVWKNRLQTDDKYVGICHYRRLLDIGDDDLICMAVNDVDIVLPFPMIHFPSARIQHTCYILEKDWETMRLALKELQPEYEERFDEIFNQPYFYNYNIMIAKKKVFADYCAWLYPILERIEENSDPKGKDRTDRYIGYMSESLTTLYFMFHQADLKIYHTGRLLFT